MRVKREKSVLGVQNIIKERLKHLGHLFTECFKLREKEEQEEAHMVDIDDKDGTYKTSFIKNLDTVPFDSRQNNTIVP